MNFFNITSIIIFLSQSVANQVSYIKIGGFNRLERVNKLNRLLEIESILANRNMLFSPDNKLIDQKIVEIEIPEEFVESVQGYVHSIEEKHGKASKGAKNQIEDHKI